MNSIRFIFVLLLVISSFLCSAEFDDYQEGVVPVRNIRNGDVPSVFFSPFRIVGKRSQFYGLYKQLEKSDN